MLGAQSAQGVTRPPTFGTLPQAAKSEATPLLDPPNQPAGGKDVLLNTGGKRLAADLTKKHEKGTEDDVHTGYLALRVAVLTGGSCAMLALTLCAVALFYRDWPLWVLITFLLTLLKSLLIYMLFGSKRWHRWLGPLLAAAACAGVVIGLNAYYNYLVYYDFYRTAERHVNVAASDDVLQFEDSGLLSFTTGTRVDATRSVGYQSARKDAKLCVAPIIDSLMGPTDVVSFFAIGVDCCAWRLEFSCGDASDGEAHGGVLRVDLATLLSPITAWAFEDAELVEGFEAALSLQQASFGTAIANQTRLLRWVRDPVAEQDKYRSGAIVSISVWSSILALALLAAGIVGAAGPQKTRRFLRKGHDIMDSELHGEPFHTKNRPGRMRKSDVLFWWL
uniref:Transmembrane protein n=1 Tax=Pyrodinium bahamense TaxID=73915 RepID=A0A7S0FFC6_9DINO|mmetsp:Transcript_27654/g.76059  ORF Transcript_27654/g.76059 Transcript_27654/m.76059 type:complete len:391 (+) Transcript_27654:133-1305(+)